MARGAGNCDTGAMGSREFEAELAQTARLLRVMAGAMAGGIALGSAVVALFVMRGAPVEPGPGDFSMVRLLTIIHAVLAVALHGAAGPAYDLLLRRRPGGEFKALRSAEVARLALGEGPALLGLAVCLIAGIRGVLQAEPAYWANAASPLLFLIFVSSRWPTEERLRETVRSRFPAKSL